jgi:hypothetical protein
MSATDNAKKRAPGHDDGIPLRFRFLRQRHPGAQQWKEEHQRLHFHRDALRVKT